MRMDWAWAITTLLWVSGLSVVLSVVSVANYRAGLERVRLWQVLGRLNYLLIADIGGALFLIGLWLTGAPVEQKLFWTFGVLWLLVETYLAWRRK